MDDDTASSLRALVAAQPIAALGTLHRTREGDEPFVSMVPVAWLPGAVAVAHVSRLAPHTGDLERSPQASLMLIAPRKEGDDPQALARLSLQVRAELLPRDSPADEAARAAYLARFPRAEQTFGLGDFVMVRLEPRSARYVAGFGRAHGLTAAALAQLLG